MIKTIQNAVPDDVANNIRNEFLTTEYDKIIQERKYQFAKAFPNAQDTIPSIDEVYHSEFYRSNFLDRSETIKNCFEEYIKPAIEQAMGKPVTGSDIRCYKMTEGGHFRLHKDAYTADIGFIWYLSKNWKWDWGGLLVMVNEDETATVAIPKFNQLVVMDHKYSQIPHTVTQVSRFALEPRLMMVGFLQYTVNK